LIQVRIRIAYADPDFLKPHEEHIGERVKEVRDSILKKRILRKPLIADERTGVILDGTHRYQALREIGVSRIPVVYVDYLSEEEIRLSGWIRIYVFNRRSIDILNKVVGIFSNISENLSIKRTRDSYIIRLERGEPLKIYRDISVMEKHDVVRENLSKVLFYTRIDRRMISREPSIAIIPPILSKTDVLRAGLGKEPLPPKSTRHITILKRIELHSRIEDLL